MAVHTVILDGISPIEGSIVRPVPSVGPLEKDFFWSKDFQVGETHVFEVIPIEHPTIISYPHRNNDVLLTHVGQDVSAGVVDMSQMYNVLFQVAKNTIEEALDTGNLLISANGNRYVIEGEDCQSLGIYKREDPQDLDHPHLVAVELGRPLLNSTPEDVMFHP